MGRIFYNLTKLSSKELRKAERFVYYRCNFKRLNFKLILLAVIFLISLDYAMYDENGKVLILLCVILLFEILFAPFLEIYKRSEETWTLEVYNNYLMVGNLEDKIMIRYEEISNIMESKEFYFLVFRKSAIPINKNSFISGNSKDFKDFILQKIY